MILRMSEQAVSVSARSWWRAKGGMVRWMCDRYSLNGMVATCLVQSVGQREEGGGVCLDKEANVAERDERWNV